MTTRICEVCGSSTQETIYRQHFLFPGLDRSIHYDVETCQACGFVFANNIPDQSALNHFYQTSTHHLHTQLPLGLQRIHVDFFHFINQHATLKKDVRILDIGSGMGHFLHHFQNAGFHQLLGIEPSATATELAQKTYDLDIREATIDNFSTNELFGLVSLCGVLEHIAELRSSMAQITSWVQNHGYIFIAVPDAATFGRTIPAEPFLEFALEHINFFTATSLDNLLRARGFEKVAVTSRHNDFYGNYYLLALYRRMAEPSMKIAIDMDAAPSLRDYVRLSRQALQQVEAHARQLERSQEPLLIWGAGALTSRLLCDTRLGRANILCIIDRNKGLQGKNLLNIPINAPESITKYLGATIFIASTTYAAEIHETLLRKYQWSGRIISLIQGDPL